LDGQQTTYWAGKDQDVTGTLTLDLGQKKSVNVFELREPIQMGQRVGAYRMEYLDEAGKWSTLHVGKTIGYRSQIRFPAVTAQKFRLVIEDGRTTPLISAIGLYWNPYDDRKHPDNFKPGETETGTREEAAI
jgi:alpha-L-fucosidase